MIKCDSLGVLKILMRRYPITLSEFQKELGVSKLERGIKSLQRNFSSGRSPRQSFHPTAESGRPQRKS
ncbi:MAG: hypothetical protein QMC77_02310 [Methanocellales archaeon]|nr:hypothetical protein [Methanocellales archaeon]